MEATRDHLSLSLWFEKRNLSIWIHKFWFTSSCPADDPPLSFRMTIFEFFILSYFGDLLTVSVFNELIASCRRLSGRRIGMKLKLIQLHLKKSRKSGASPVDQRIWVLSEVLRSPPVNDQRSSFDPHQSLISCVKFKLLKFKLIQNPALRISNQGAH